MTETAHAFGRLLPSGLTSIFIIRRHAWTVDHGITSWDRNPTSSELLHYFGGAPALDDARKARSLWAIYWHPAWTRDVAERNVACAATLPALMRLYMDRRGFRPEVIEAAQTTARAFASIVPNERDFDWYHHCSDDHGWLFKSTAIPEFGSFFRVWLHSVRNPELHKPVAKAGAT